VGAVDRYIARLVKALAERATERTLQEVTEHLRESAEHYMRRGMTPGDAELRAVADFGSVEDIAEQFLEPANAEVVAFARRGDIVAEMIEVEVGAVMVESVTDDERERWKAKGWPAVDDTKRYVVLRERGGPRQLALFIGTFEAASIAMAKEGTTTPRPMTHDLFGSLIGALGDVSLDRVVITKLEDETFYAEMEMTHHGDRVAVDCRPSDGIAVAVRLGVPIFVSRSVPPFSQAA
jgi:bifunctional DNase/RNase